MASVGKYTIYGSYYGGLMLIKAVVVMFECWKHINMLEASNHTDPSMTTQGVQTPGQVAVLAIFE